MWRLQSAAAAAPATVGAAAAITARRGVSAKEVFEDEEVHHGSVDHLHEAAIGELGHNKVPVPELLLGKGIPLCKMTG